MTPDLFSSLLPRKGDRVRVQGRETIVESERLDEIHRSTFAPNGWVVCLTPWLSIRDRWFKCEDVEVLP